MKLFPPDPADPRHFKRGYSDKAPDVKQRQGRRKVKANQLAQKEAAAARRAEKAARAAGPLAGGGYVRVVAGEPVRPDPKFLKAPEAATKPIDFAAGIIAKAEAGEPVYMGPGLAFPDAEGRPQPAPNANGQEQ